MRGRSRRFQPAMIETLEQRALLKVSFYFAYAGEPQPDGIGFEDPTLGQARRDALEAAARQLGSQFADTGKVRIAVDSIEDPTSDVIAAITGAHVASDTAFGGIGVVRNKILNGVDLNGRAADAELEVNFAYDWELSPDPAANDGTEEDFQSTMMHELLHAMGFASTIGRDGSSVFDASPGQATQWVEFDQFLVSAASESVIDADGSLDLEAWQQHSTGGTSRNGRGLFFNGPNAVAANDGEPVGLYTPRRWEEGSSVSHLDDQNRAYAGSMMLSAASNFGSYARTLSPVERGIMQDLGYTFIQPGVRVAKTGGRTTVSERGDIDFLRVTLESPPTSDVVIDVTVGDSTEIAVSQSRLTFSPWNWNVPQPVTVTGLPDELEDGEQRTTLTFSVDALASDATFESVADVVTNVTTRDVEPFGPYVRNGRLEVYGTLNADSILLTEDATHITVDFNRATYVFDHTGLGRVIAWGAEGIDIIDGRGMQRRLTIIGGPGSDTLVGGPKNDVIRGGSGNDVIQGGDRHDNIAGGSGRDTIFAGSGRDTLTGGSGADVIFGENGSDLIVGGSSKDRLDGGAGRDVLVGGTGSDTMWGGEHDDILLGAHTVHSLRSLKTIFREWISSRDYQQRRTNIRFGAARTDNRRNNAYLVGVNRSQESTIRPTDEGDQMRGNQGLDWFFQQLPFDIIADLERTESRDLI